MFTCPSCNEKAIRTMAKLPLGPGSRLSCPKCHADLTIDRRSYFLSSIPVMVLFVAMLAWFNELVLFFGLIVSLAVNVGYSKLVVRDNPGE